MQQAQKTSIQMTTRSKVPFTVSNVTKCMCPKCPVQSKSQCSTSKMATIKESLKKPALNREDIPGEYCSTGAAACKDLDPKQSCICGSCSVFFQYKLAAGQPAGYYCRDGAAR